MVIYNSVVSGFPLSRATGLHLSEIEWVIGVCVIYNFESNPFHSVDWGHIFSISSTVGNLDLIIKCFKL